MEALRLSLVPVLPRVEPDAGIPVSSSVTRGNITYITLARTPRESWRGRKQAPERCPP